MTPSRFRRFGNIALALLSAGCGPVSSALLSLPSRSPYSATSGGGAAGASLPSAGNAASFPGAGPAIALPTGPSPGPPGITTSRSVAYRLRLRGNPVDPVGARHCYADCRTAATEADLLACISECPGFEALEEGTCSAADGLPRSLCIGPSAVPSRTEPGAGALFLAIVADMALYLGLAAACNSASSASASCATGW